MKNFKRHGETIAFTAAADTPSGQLVLVGGVAAIALNNVLSGQVGEARAEGVYELPKQTATTAAVGLDAYVTAGGNVTGTASGNTRIGRFWAAAVADTVTALVKINTP
ncbi:MULTISPECIES: DUF2190 family protein [Luteimonas]|uniref:DUF2190 family protein n=1 Tax=Luteimonas TaxID=83614 RepID=UPI000C7DEA8B|nr:MULTISPECIES: capsid cement protein [Luteimonas]